MYKVGRIGFMLLLVVSLAMGSRAAWAKDSAPGAPVELSILSVNDFHGALVEAGKNPGVAKLGKFIKGERDKNPTGTIILSAGDMFQGSADSNLLYGKTVVEAMNEIGFDAMVVGNHEFDWGIDKLKKQIEQSKFPYLGANMVDRRTGKTADFINSHIIITRNGINVGIIGIITPETSYKSAPKVVQNYEFVEPARVVNEWSKKLRDQGADVIIVLSHMGCEMDQGTGEIVGEAAELAKAVQGVDLLITGHSHQRVMGRVNGIPIMQAG
jgi:5'-nucleotidase / UDP-sugar diphosphatase